MRYFLGSIFLVFLALGCGKDSRDEANPNISSYKVNFANSAIAIEEGEIDKSILLKLDQASDTNVSVTIEVSSLSNNIAFRISSDPTISNGRMTVIIPKGSTERTINITSNADIDHTSEEVILAITNVSGGATVGSTASITLTIHDTTAANPQYLSCLPRVFSDTLEIVSWNIKRFPQSNATLDALVQLVELIDADVIAFQEITDTDQFDEMISQLDGWDGAWLNVTGDIELGYLFKTAEITTFSPLTTLFDNDGFSFPREAVVTDITHSSGLSIKLVNIHLKCCSEGFQRRETASSQMKIYADINWPFDNVMILGDFNDNITGSSPFTNFLSDPEDYFFADMSIATGSSDLWSFPSFPSHIDHMLCTNELNTHFVDATTVRINECVRGYDDIISDHRPVLARFK